MVVFKSKLVALSEILVTPIQTGFQVRGGLHKKTVYREGAVSLRDKSYKLIQVKDVVRGVWHDIKSKDLDTFLIPEGKSKFMKKYLLRKEDVLYLSKLHPGAFRYRGHVGDVLPMTHFYILRPHLNLVDPDYLCWALNQSWIIGAYVQKLMIGSSLLFISRSDLLNFKIPLPTIKVQKKIISLLKLRAREQELQEQLDNKKNILINKALSQLL